MFKTLLQADTKEDGNFALCEYFTVTLCSHQT